jgi:3-phenylpropionate/trans-cinnamate dioxygenase ferredoxin subunit
MAYTLAAKLDEVPSGRIIVVTVGETEIALGNVGGQIYAVANLCTHDGGPLGEGELVDRQVECPRHGARFDLRSGQVRALPAVVPIPTYDVRLEGEDILVDVG